MLLHAGKDLFDKLDLVDVAQQFVSLCREENFPRDRNGQELILVKLLRATHTRSLIEKALKNQLIN